MNNCNALFDYLHCIKFSSYKDLGKKSKSLLRCSCRISLTLIKNVFFGQYRCLRTKKKVLLIAPTLNNLKTIIPIQNNMDKNTCHLVDSFYKLYPLGMVCLYSIMHVFYFIRYYRSKNSEDRKVIRYFFFDFFTTLGYYKAAEQFLKNNLEIKVIVFANDHTMQNLCLIDFANRYNIPTIYTQHASVTEKFPSLRFTYSFLDGLESWEKYRNIGGCKGTVLLSGSPRFDVIHTLDRSIQKRRIGIALNMWDSIDKVRELCCYIQKELGREIVLRPHPALEKQNWHPFINMGVVMSYPSEEGSFNFLSGIELLIANESSIHLDAALMNVPSILYNFSDKEIVDWYSYVKKGLINIAGSKEDILNMSLNSKKTNVGKVQYYVASFGTLHEGKIGKHIADFIKGILEGSERSFIKRYYTFKGDCYMYK